MVWYRRPNYSCLALFFGHKYKHSLLLQHLELFNSVNMVTSWVTALSCSGKRDACHYVEGGQQIPCQTGSTQSQSEVWFTSKFMCCHNFSKHRPYMTSIKYTCGMRRGCGQRPECWLHFMGHLKVAA